MWDAVVRATAARGGESTAGHHRLGQQQAGAPSFFTPRPLQINGGWKAAAFSAWGEGQAGAGVALYSGWYQKEAAGGASLQQVAPISGSASWGLRQHTADMTTAGFTPAWTRRTALRSLVGLFLRRNTLVAWGVISCAVFNAFSGARLRGVP